MMLVYEEVPYIEIEDSDDEDTRNIQNQREAQTCKTNGVSDVDCPISYCSFKITLRTHTRMDTAERSMQQHIMLKHSERKKSFAMDKAFPPHSRSKGYPCRLCYKGQLDVHLFKKLAQREAHTVRIHSSYFDMDFVRRLTDSAFTNQYASVDELFSEDEMDQDPSQGSTESISQSLDDSVVILDVDEENNDRNTSVDELLMTSVDEIDQYPTLGEQQGRTEGVPQSLDDSIVILDVGEEDNDRYTSREDLLMSDAEFNHSREEHQRDKVGGVHVLDDSDYEVITID